MRLYRLFLVFGITTTLLGCAQLASLNPENHYQCTVKNLTSQKKFVAYADTQARALGAANERCVQGSEYGWRCAMVSCKDSRLTVQPQ